MVQVSSQLQAYGHLEGLFTGLELGALEIQQVIGNPICVEKCGLCCQVNTPVVTELEADYIIGTYGANPKFKALVHRNLEWMTDPVYGSENSDPGSLQQKADKLANKRCPFLEPDMSCAIHDARPAICRAYGVTVAANDWCERPLSSGETSSHRAVIGRGTRVGRLLEKAKTDMREYADGIGKGTLAFLPFWITKAMASKELKDQIQDGKVSQAKMAMGRSNLNLFKGQDKIIQLVEKEFGDDKLVRLSGEY